MTSREEAHRLVDEQYDAIETRKSYGLIVCGLPANISPIRRHVWRFFCLPAATVLGFISNSRYQPLGKFNSENPFWKKLFNLL